MINLTPIAKPIQERMFEKMRVLGRGKKYIGQQSDADELQLQDMTTRTTFIRMISGQERPVVMMGGELSEDNEMMTGFKDIYGPKTYGKSDTGPLGEEIKLSSENQYYYEQQDTGNAVVVDKPNNTIKHSNSFKRPIPGIKSIDVQFKGGVRALRTANISWICWTFEDLDRLRTHFLSHGKTVALEWGWVYNRKQFEQLDTLIKSDGTIDKSGFEDYREKINKAKGDFDFMVGIVKNFEYTTRDDGGFDCKTDIVSTGISILDTSTNTNASKLNLYNISEDDTVDEKIEKLKAIKNDKKELENIAFNSKLSLGIFMNRFNSWLKAYHGSEGTVETISSETPSGDAPSPSSFNLGGVGAPALTAEMEQGGFQWIENTGNLDQRIKYYYIDENKNFIFPDAHSPGSMAANQLENFNALREPQEDIIVGDYVVSPSCYIMQNIGKVNITKTAWVRWGWFEDNILNKFVSYLSPKAKEETAKIINEMRSVNRIIDKDEDGNPIPTNGFVSTLIRNHELLETTDTTKFILPGQFSSHQEDSEALRNLVSIVNSNFSKFETNNFKQGYFRNILFNTNFLMECFALTDNNDFATGLDNLFNGMNQDINFWQLTTETDAIETHRLKIIDEYSTYYDWMSKAGKAFEPLEKKTTINDVGEIVGKEGVFHFPVWKHNSIVKRQSLNAKVPKAMQMAAMYGANLDTMTNLMGTDENLPIQGQAAGALGKNANDVYKKGADLAFKFEYTSKGEVSFGKPGGSEAGPLSLKDGVKLGVGDLYYGQFFIDELEGVISNEIADQVAEKSGIRIPELGEEGYNELLDYTFSSAGDSTAIAEGKLDYIEDQAREREEYESRSIFNPSKWIKMFRWKDKEEKKTTYSGMLPTAQVFSDPTELKEFEQNLQKLVTQKGVVNINGKLVKLKNPNDVAKLRTILNTMKKKYNLNGKMNKNFRDRIAKFVTIYGSERTSTLPILIPLELQLTIDGIGGIYPGNSFHSDYVPSRYKSETMFQCFDINHTVDSSGWSVSLSGKMRASLAGLYDSIHTSEEKVGEAVQEVYDELTVPFDAKKDP